LIGRRYLPRQLRFLSWMLSASWLWSTATNEWVGLMPQIFYSHSMMRRGGSSLLKQARLIEKNYNFSSARMIGGSVDIFICDHPRTLLFRRQIFRTKTCLGESVPNYRANERNDPCSTRFEKSRTPGEILAYGILYFGTMTDQRPEI
jgi:hypothetical protein